MGTPLVIPAAVEADTPEWQRLVAHAVSEADRLGLELTIASSPGWSSAGGPWVAVADAMQKLVWSETSMSGGSGHVLLPPLPDVAGPYQEIPSADANEVPRYAHDLLVVAFPDDADQRPLVPRRVTGSAEIHDPAVLWDGRFDDAVEMPRDPNAPSTAWIQQSFDEPVTVSSVTIATPAPHGFGAAPAPECTLECSEDGLTYSQVMHLSPTPIDVRTSTFTPITAQHFRLTLRGDTALSVLPKLSPELAVPNVLRSKASFVLTEFSLWQHPRIHQGELKAGFAAASDYFPLDTPPSEARLRPEDVLDVTEHLGPDGVLRWDAPDGQWRILRLGCSPTGHMNGPAPAAMTGLEVDKMDAAKVKRYLAHHLGRFKDFLHADGNGPRIAGFLNDSIESGPQNATTRLRAALLRVARLRHRTVGAVLYRAHRRRRIIVRQIPLRLPADPLRAPLLRLLRDCAGGCALVRAHLLRRGARGRTTAARQRSSDAFARGRADGRCVGIRRGHRHLPSYLHRRPTRRVIRRTRLRQRLHRRRIDDGLPSRVELHTPQPQACGRSRTVPRGDTVLHPHLPASAQHHSTAWDRARSLPRPGLHAVRNVGGVRGRVDRLPRPLLMASESRRAGSGRGRIHR